MSLQIGSRIGPYEVQAVLGSGGMGEVYRATDLRLMRDVAIKTLPAEFTGDSERLQRFEFEARTAGALSHPNILAIYDFGVHDGAPYLVEELLLGESLRSLIDRDRLLPRSAVEYAVQISSGLGAAHERGIIHRDLKPENIFVTRDDLIKILDFGLAKLAKPDSAEGNSILPTRAQTEPGMLIGTVAYMSPEQARSQVLDARSDIFSFGAILYEMLAGQRAFRGGVSADVLSSILRDPVDFSCLDPNIPPELLRVVVRCLEKNPADRFQSIRDITFALRMIEANLFLQASGTSAVKSMQMAPTIAVLPFTDMSSERDQEYFCDGLAEELITAFARITGLQVASRTSAFQYKHRQADIREIGRQLNVGTVLDGSVRKSGKRIRVTAELINASDGYHLWSEKYDRNLEDIFSIQDEIARTIVNTLKVQLIGAPERPLVLRYTDNMEAYNLYLKGRHLWKSRTRSGLRKATEYFRQAIEQDSGYALAHAGLADCYSVAGFYGFMNTSDAQVRALQAAEKSLELDPLLPEGHISLGAAVLYFDYDWDRADKAYRRGLELNPHLAMAYCWYSGFLTLSGRYEEGAATIKKAIELDPLSPLFASFAALSYYALRKYDQCLQEASKALEIDPEFLLAHWYSGMCFSKKGMHQQAIDSLERAVQISERGTFFLSCLGLIYGEAGEIRRAAELLAEMDQRSLTEYVPPFHFARVYMGLNQIDRTFAEFEKARQERNVLIYLPHSPEFDPIRSDPRFESLLKRLKLKPKPS